MEGQSPSAMPSEPALSGRKQAGGDGWVITPRFRVARVSGQTQCAHAQQYHLQPQHGALVSEPQKRKCPPNGFSHARHLSVCVFLAVTEILWLMFHAGSSSIFVKMLKPNFSWSGFPFEASVQLEASPWQGLAIGAHTYSGHSIHFVLLSTSNPVRKA